MVRPRDVVDEGSLILRPEGVLSGAQVEPGDRQLLAETVGSPEAQTRETESVEQNRNSFYDRVTITRGGVRGGDRDGGGLNKDRQRQ